MGVVSRFRMTPDGPFPMRLLRRGAASRPRPEARRPLPATVAADPQGRPKRILVLGTASATDVRACLTACHGEALLLLPAKHRSSFPDVRVRAFQGLLACRAEILDWVRDFAPDEA